MQFKSKAPTVAKKEKQEATPPRLSRPRSAPPGTCSPPEDGVLNWKVGAPEFLWPMDIPADMYPPVHVDVKFDENLIDKSVEQLLEKAPNFSIFTSRRTSPASTSTRSRSAVGGRTACSSACVTSSWA